MTNTEHKIKIVICDDMPFIAENFKNTLSLQDDFDIVAVTTGSKTCIAAVTEHNPDIVLLDIQMNFNDEGILILKKIKELRPETKVIMCTIHFEDELILRSFVYGASGYIVKTEPTDVIVKTIREVYRNNVSLSADIAQKIIKTSVSSHTEKHDISRLLDTVATLTTAEYEVLKLIYSGNSYSSIADRRYVSESTIRSQVNKILHKFGFKSMKQLINHLKSLQIFD